MEERLVVNFNYFENKDKTSFEYVAAFEGPALESTLYKSVFKNPKRTVIKIGKNFRIKFSEFVHEKCSSDSAYNCQREKKFDCSSCKGHFDFVNKDIYSIGIDNSFQYDVFVAKTNNEFYKRAIQDYLNSFNMLWEYFEKLRKSYGNMEFDFDCYQEHAIYEYFNDSFIIDYRKPLFSSFSFVSLFENTIKNASKLFRLREKNNSLYGSNVCSYCYFS